MRSDTMRNATALLFLSFTLCACGERPQRLGKGESNSQADSKAAKPARFSGSIVLEGGMAAIQNGALFVSARRKGQRLPTLSRKYELTDPAWSTQDGNRVLSFSLTDDDNMAGFGAPMGAEMEVEARYSP